MYSLSPDHVYICLHLTLSPCIVFHGFGSYVKLIKYENKNYTHRSNHIVPVHCAGTTIASKHWKITPRHTNLYPSTKHLTFFFSRLLFNFCRTVRHLHGFLENRASSSVVRCAIQLHQQRINNQWNVYQEMRACFSIILRFPSGYISLSVCVYLPEIHSVVFSFFYSLETEIELIRLRANIWHNSQNTYAFVNAN